MLVSTFCALFYKSLRSTAFVVFIICFASCASHAILDGLTNGGLGVALYWPFDNQRLFLPFRPIQVSPIGVQAFFTETGLQVILSELLWICLPAILFALVGKKVRR
jgi:inner membrane protein